MDERKKIFMLRFAYWFGAVLDGLTFLLMIFPTLGGGVFSSSLITYDASYYYANALGAPLMIGWAVLLIWADRKPIERKGIILITLFPVMAGLIAANSILYLSGITEMEDFLSRMIIQFLVVFILSSGYYLTREIKTYSN
jgi:hypothetical protein